MKGGWRGEDREGRKVGEEGEGRMVTGGWRGEDGEGRGEAGPPCCITVL